MASRVLRYNQLRPPSFRRPLGTLDALVGLGQGGVVAVLGAFGEFVYLSQGPGTSRQRE